VLIKAPRALQACGQVGREEGSCRQTGVLCSPPWAPAVWEPNTADGPEGVALVLGEIFAWSELCMAVTYVTSKLYV